jgi:PIN domain nuclease of toxin-antitoxin system
MVVLDTHAWLWWVADRSRLSSHAAAAIEQAGSIGVAAISCWEVAMLVLRGRIELDRDLARWVRQALAQEGVVALPLTPPVALAAALLEREEFAGDPADRMIYATAREAGARLITRDARIREFDPRGTLW